MKPSNGDVKVNRMCSEGEALFPESLRAIDIMHKLKLAILVCVALTLVGVWILAPRSVEGQSPRLSFAVLASEETGLGPLMDNWYADEQARLGRSSIDWWPWGVILFDYDDDGDLDLLLSQHGTLGAVLARNRFLETGRVEFESAMADIGIAPDDFPSMAGNPVIWDMNGDGILDVAIPYVLESGGRSFFNRPDGTFQLTPFSFSPLRQIAGLVDLNGDGFLDAWGVGRGTPGPFVRHSFIYQSVTETFQLNTSNYRPADVPEDLEQLIREEVLREENLYLTISYFREYDLNGDGIEDTVLQGHGAYGGSVFGRYCIALPSGPCTDETVTNGLPEVGAPILIRDLTGDGSVDVLIAAGGDASGLYVNNGFGRFTRMSGDVKNFLGDRESYLHRAFAADFDNDGDLDLVLSKPIYRNGEIFENVGTGNVFERAATFRGWSGYPIAVGDVNLDGLVDLVVGGPDSTSVSVYVNQTLDTGNYADIYPRMDNPNPFAVGSRIELFAAGTMGIPGAHPYLSEEAHADGLPVHVGLGSATNFDLQITFPDGRVSQRANVEASPRLTLEPNPLSPPIGIPRVRPLSK